MGNQSAGDDIAAFRPGAQYNFSGGGAPEEVAATLTTRNLFDVLGVTMLHGQPWPESYDLERNNLLLSRNAKSQFARRWAQGADV